MRALTRLAPAAAALAILSASPRGAVAQAADSSEPAAPQHSPVYVQMRREALTTPPEELQFEGRRPRVWGSVMDVGLPSGRVATLVVFADGTTNLYSSAGGGIVGSGSQRAVSEASDEFLEEAAEAVRSMADPPADFPLPGPGQVRFWLRTNSGLRAAVASEAELKAGSHALSELFEAGQAVLSRVRPLSEHGSATTQP